MFIWSSFQLNYIEGFIVRFSEFICVYIKIVLSLYLLLLNFISFFFSQAWWDGVPLHLRDSTYNLFMVIVILHKLFLIVNCENEFSFHPIIYLSLWLTYWFAFVSCWIVTLNNLYHESISKIWLIVTSYLDLFIITKEFLPMNAQIILWSRMSLVKFWFFQSIWIKT